MPSQSILLFACASAAAGIRVQKWDPSFKRENTTLILPRQELDQETVQYISVENVNCPRERKLSEWDCSQFHTGANKTARNFQFMGVVNDSDAPAGCFWDGGYSDGYWTRNGGGSMGGTNPRAKIFYNENKDGKVRMNISAYARFGHSASLWSICKAPPMSPPTRIMNGATACPPGKGLAEWECSDSSVSYGAWMTVVTVYSKGGVLFGGATSLQPNAQMLTPLHGKVISSLCVANNSLATAMTEQVNAFSSLSGNRTNSNASAQARYSYFFFQVVDIPWDLPQSEIPNATAGNQEGLKTASLLNAGSEELNTASFVEETAQTAGEVLNAMIPSSFSAVCKV